MRFKNPTIGESAAILTLAAIALLAIILLTGWKMKGGQISPPTQVHAANEYCRIDPVETCITPVPSGK